MTYKNLVSQDFLIPSRSCYNRNLICNYITRVSMVESHEIILYYKNVAYSELLLWKAKLEIYLSIICLQSRNKMQKTISL